MREIEVSQITDIVEKLCIAANEHLPEDVKCAIRSCRACEDGQIAQGILDNIIENFEIADNECVPICQDTGMACVFIELGQDVHINGDLDEAVNEGVRRGYEKAYLRKSITADPLQRVNTGDNTPAFLTVHLVPGDVCKITVAPKGAGSENMSRIQMLKPADGVEGFKTDGGEFLFGSDFLLRDGTHGVEAHNLYAMQYVRAYNEWMRRQGVNGVTFSLSLIHISEPTRH